MLGSILGLILQNLIKDFNNFDILPLDLIHSYIELIFVYNAHIDLKQIKTIA